jgi:two-component system NarL family sensor kinase
MKPLALFFFLNFVITCAAQNSEKSALLHQINTAPDDTAKVYLYYAYGNLVENENLDSALFFYNKAKTLAEKLNFLKGQFKYAANYSAVMNMQGKLDESYAINKWALDFALRHNLPDVPKAYTNLGNSLQLKGHYDSASIYYLKAIEGFEKSGETQYLNILYQSMGVLFESLKQYDMAHRYHDKSIALSARIKDSLTLSSELVNKAIAYTMEKKMDEALPLLQQAIAIMQLNGYTAQEASALINLGNLYRKKKQYPQASEAFKRSVALSEKLDYAMAATALSGLAVVYDDMGDYATANRYMEEALPLLEKEASFDELVYAYRSAALIKSHLKDYKAAYPLLEKYVTLNDSLTNINISKGAAELERKYETAKKDKALLDQQLVIARNKAQLQARQTWLVVTFSVIALLLVASFFGYRSYRNRQKLQQQKIIALQKQAEVIRLKATLEGQQDERQRIAKEIHDEIGSGLTTIVFLSNSAGNDERLEKIGTTARLLVNQMNEIVWSMSAGQDKLEELVAYIRHNMGDLLSTVNIDYEFIIPDQIPDVNISGVQRRNIYLAVKEAVHNSIKHAGATMVFIEMDFTDGLTIKIKDNGKGMETVRKFGNGMKNMKHRMEYTGGSFTLLNDKPVQIEMKLPADKIV